MTKAGWVFVLSVLLIVASAAASMIALIWDQDMRPWWTLAIVGAAVSVGVCVVQIIREDD